MIMVIDYGMGNLRSVRKALERLGAAVTITSEPEQVRQAEKLILPGVGAMCDSMQQLREHQLIEPIQEYIRSGRPFLGICLGLQMLFERSLEDGEHAGLAIFPGDVVRFELPNDYAVPHMGWNALRLQRQTPLLAHLPAVAHTYFVHSYYVVPKQPEIVCATADYGIEFTAAVAYENVYATQFHPEKSQQVGLRILANFIQL